MHKKKTTYLSNPFYNLLLSSDLLFPRITIETEKYIQKSSMCPRKSARTPPLPYCPVSGWNRSSPMGPVCSRAKRFLSPAPLLGSS